MWGGENINTLFGHRAHDLYLDTYDEAGLIALITIAIYIICSLSRMVKCLKCKSLSTQVKLLIACVYVACNIQFWLEPILRGVPWLLASYCFIDGAVSRLIKNERRFRIQCYSDEKAQKQINKTF